ncbi:uncharacterized protein [Rutidosis leptorrhynchoides]|uniref:uncharacterized protein n=1 Tax=Rutidosis leptorrhynchoides TaxID=125765 RepID=UPI003A9A2FED
MDGFNNWKKTERLKEHVGHVYSFHNTALQKCQSLKKPNQSIANAFNKQDEKSKTKYRMRLSATISACRYCLKCSLPFCGHDELEKSIYKGNFLKLMDVIYIHNEELRKLPKAPGNNKLMSSYIQKDVVKCFKQELLECIFKEIGDGVFALLVDESSDVSKKEQMVIVLRYVDAQGFVKERFVGLVHVKDTSSFSLKASIDSFFFLLNINGCSGCKKYLGIVNFFDKIAVLLNVVCASCKRKDILIDTEKERVKEQIGSGKLETGTGLNQELSLTRPGYTRWNSHYNTHVPLVEMFPSVIKKALQRKDQDILEAVQLVESTKEKLQELRINGFELFLTKVSSFCEEHGIRILNMNEDCINSRRQREKITNQYYYEIECFNTVLDMQIQEFGDRFNEASTELLSCMSALNPRDSFSMFDSEKLRLLCDLYPKDFTSADKIELEDELQIYHHSVQKDPKFKDLKGIADLARVMVETRKYISYLLVYRLLKLALVLPVATATVERCFSAMKIVKSNLCNRISEEFLNACLICTIEREALAEVKDEDLLLKIFAPDDRES